MREAYFKALVQFTGRPKSVPGFKFVYTPMHGVGLCAMKQAMERLGLLESLVVVEEQVSTSPNTTHQVPNIMMLPRPFRIPNSPP